MLGCFFVGTYTPWWMRQRKERRQREENYHPPAQSAFEQLNEAYKITSSINAIAFNMLTNFTKAEVPEQELFFKQEELERIASIYSDTPNLLIAALRLNIAHSEFLSQYFRRWAEQLHDKAVGKKLKRTKYTKPIENKHRALNAAVKTFQEALLREMKSLNE